MKQLAENTRGRAPALCRPRGCSRTAPFHDRHLHRLAQDTDGNWTPKSQPRQGTWEKCPVLSDAISRHVI